MLKEFKKISIKKALLNFVVCCVLGTIAFAGTSGDHIFKTLGRPTLLDVENIGLYEGEYVSATIDFNFGRFAYTTDGEKMISHEFAVADADGGYIYSLYMDERDYKKIAGWLPPDDSGTVEPRTVKGTLVKMTAEEQEFFDELLESLDIPLEWKAPYYLKMGYVGENTSFLSSLIFSIGALFFFGLGLLFVILAATGYYQKSIVQYCKKSGAPAYAMELLEGQFAVAEKFKGSLWAMPQFFILQNGMTTRLLPASDVVWAFQRVTRTNGIVSGRGVVFATTEKKQQAAALPEKEITRCLDFIFERYPHIAIGYNDHLNSLWSRGPADLMAFAAQQHGVPAAPPAMPPIMAQPITPQAAPQPMQQQAVPQPMQSGAPIAPAAGPEHPLEPPQQ